MNEFSNQVQNELLKDEHADVEGRGAKKVINLDPVTGEILDPRHLYGWDSSASVWRALQVVESTTNPGEYVLAVGNIDGSPITGGGGGEVTYSDYLLESDEFLLLESEDNLLLQA